MKYFQQYLKTRNVQAGTYEYVGSFIQNYEYVNGVFKELSTQEYQDLKDLNMGHLASDDMPLFELDKIVDMDTEIADNAKLVAINAIWATISTADLAYAQAGDTASKDKIAQAILDVEDIKNSGEPNAGEEKNASKASSATVAVPGPVTPVATATASNIKI